MEIDSKFAYHVAAFVWRRVWDIINSPGGQDTGVFETSQIFFAESCSSRESADASSCQ